MRFTREVLDYARALSAERYPNDAGGIHFDCMLEAIRCFRSQHRQTLIVY